MIATIPGPLSSGPFSGRGGLKKFSVILLRRFCLLFLDCRCWSFWWRRRRGSVAYTTWYAHFPALFAGDVGGARFPAYLLLLILYMFSLLWINLRCRRWGYWLWYNLLCCFVVVFFFFFLEDVCLEKLSIECYTTEWSLGLWRKKWRK